MYTREDFRQVIADTISSYPVAAAYYKAGDPRLLSQLDAIATMCAMLSQQIEVAALEPAIMSRDATVLAVAALKGILPFARPALGTMTVTNPTTAPFTVAAGRVVLDSSGRPWVVQSGVTVPAGQSRTVPILQQTERSYVHTVTESRPFYQIEVTQPAQDQFIVSVALTRTADSVSFRYTPEYANVEPGDTSFVIETDEYRRVLISFGYAI